MKLASALLTLCLASFAGAAGAQQPKPATEPDPNYCSQRDADPKLCTIDDGQPKVLVRKPPPVSPKRKADSAKLKSNQ